jgi:hypothetical protein
VSAGVFHGWAVAAVAVKGSAFWVRAFTVGTFHEEDARNYAITEMQRDFPGCEVVIATHALRGLEVLDRDDRI